jgi:cytochrome c biogenesis protein CcmG, thiol:disulfide interchange protein DsbE
MGMLLWYAVKGHYNRILGLAMDLWYLLPMPREQTRRARTCAHRHSHAIPHFDIGGLAPIPMGKMLTGIYVGDPQQRGDNIMSSPACRRACLVAAMLFMSMQVLAQNPPWRDPQYDTSKYDFTVKTIEGSKVQLSALKGKVVLLNLWATWCGPCRYETPGFVKVYEKLGGKDKLVFLAVAIWDEEPAIRAFIEKNKVTYLVANDSDDIVAKLYRAQSIPESYLIGPDGKLVHHFMGPVSESDLEAKLKALLEPAGPAK